MKDREVKKIQELGFEVSNEGRNGERSISMKVTPSKDVVIKMLKQLTFEDCIFFWDYYHATVTDPGGYVSAYVLDGKRAVYMEGNHGWSSKFQAISLEELSELIIKNWDKDCDGGAFLNSIKINPHHNSHKDLYLYSL